jgi:ABC-type amino acid transport system permease subunit
MKGKYFNMSFWEKSTFAVLAGIVLVYGWYGLQVMALVNSDNTDLSAIRWLIFVTIVALIVIVAGAHIIIAIIEKKYFGEIDDGYDEREQLIEHRSNSTHTYTLSAGVVITIGFALYGASMFTIVNMLIGFHAVADVVKLSTKLIEYRRGM